MFKSILFAVVFGGVLAAPAFAQDVHVKGYYKKDGTYVAPHVRSAPDSTKANNYGPSSSSASNNSYWSSAEPPRTRDADKDGSPNYRDSDDNNNFVQDDRDPFQYRQTGPN